MGKAVTIARGVLLAASLTDTQDRLAVFASRTEKNTRDALQAYTHACGELASSEDETINASATKELENLEKLRGDEGGTSMKRKELETDEEEEERLVKKSKQEKVSLLLEVQREFVQAQNSFVKTQNSFVNAQNSFFKCIEPLL